MAKQPEYNPIVRAKQKPTRANAIKAMCAHCMGCTETHLEPGFRRSIFACTSKGCPLYQYRPYQRRKTRITPETPAKNSEA